MDERLPLFVLTGFLGSGKTTLLRHLLGNPGFRDTAVIVNEFGEIGLDHELIETSEESAVVLKGGCVCCTIREDLAMTIRHLVELRRSGRISKFRRLVIETSGLVDPVPVIFTMLSDPRVIEFFHFRGVIVAVDAQNGLATLQRHEESRRQLLYANRAVITKVDLVHSGRCAELERVILRLNPSLSVLRSDLGNLMPAELLGDLFYVPAAGCILENWLGQGIKTEEAVHSGQYASLSWEFTQELDWSAFGVWLTMLLHTHGNRILRVKGILNVAGAEAPIAIHGVQHVVHPPVHLHQRKKVGQTSRIVVVVKDLDPALIRRSFAVFTNVENFKRGNMALIEVPVGTGRMIGGRPIRRPSAPSWIKG